MTDIQSVRRAFDILKVVSATPDGKATSLSEIAAQVELPKSTVSRMLSTLELVGAVERINQREGFYIGNQLIALTANVPYPRSINAIARPYLQALCDATGETLTLCVPDGDFAHYIDQINGPRALQVHDWTGQKLPLHAASDGKLYLAERTDTQIDRYVQRPMLRYSTSTIIRPAAIRRELRAVRKKGYAWTNGEYDAEIVGVAAPIRDSDGHVVASVCLFGPAFRWPKEHDAGTLIRLTRETASKISTRLGFTGPNANKRFINLEAKGKVRN